MEYRNNVKVSLFRQFSKVKNNKMNEKKKPWVSEYGPWISNWAN